MSRYFAANIPGSGLQRMGPALQLTHANIPPQAGHEMTKQELAGIIHETLINPAGIMVDRINQVVDKHAQIGADIAAIKADQKERGIHHDNPMNANQQQINTFPSTLPD